MDNDKKCQIPSSEEIKYHIKISLKVYYYILLNPKML